MPVRVDRLPDGSVELTGLDRFLVHVLQEIPELLDGDQPEQVSRRLYPAPSEDLEETREWERLVHPDLFALLAEARAVLARDLLGLEPDPGAEGHQRVVVPDAHVPAWLAALNAARLALAETHGIGQEELESTELVIRDARTFACVHINRLGWLQELLLEATDPDRAEE